MLGNDSKGSIDNKDSFIHWLKFAGFSGPSEVRKFDFDLELQYVGIFL